MNKEENKNNTDVELNVLMEQIVQALQQCYDPEIPVNIYDLGLIYEINLGETGRVRINMTLTSPACPVADLLPEEIRTRLLTVTGINKVDINLIWDPPWSPEFMSEAAKLELGLM
jgi:FeS assembly SUF system protein